MNYLRPDESEAAEDIKRSKEFDNSFKSGAKTAKSIAILGTGGALGGISSKILPFLSKYIPKELAIKGISKISPEIGSLIKRGLDQGLDVESGLDFIKSQIGNKGNPKEKRNIIEQYDPELHIYIDQNLKKGMPLLEAGNQAMKHGRFKKAIEKMTKDHKAPWSTILETVFGKMGQRKKQEEQPMQEAQQQQPSANWAAIVDSLKNVLGE